jgi:hypothetical protein
VSVHLHSVTFDCADPPALAAFWAALTGYRVEVSEEWLAILSGDGSVGPRFMFIRVPEPKAAKNRVHLRLGPELNKRRSHCAQPRRLAHRPQPGSRARLRGGR